MSTSSNKIIYQNTLFLYIRMFVVMATSLYASRVVLRVLGSEDYGLYNVVGGVIAFFFFITGTLSAATQRFMAYEIGRDCDSRRKQVFSLSLLFFVATGFIIFALGIIVGIPFIKHQLNIPLGREQAAIVVFFWSLLNAVLFFVRVPFNASIIAYERMSFYSWMSIGESFLRLFTLWLLVTIDNYDKLELYSFLNMTISIVVLLVYFAYCQYHFHDFALQGIFNRDLMKQLFSYSGWSLLGGLSDLILIQGLTIILNQSFGTIINAAHALASQIKNQIANLVNNVNVASTPAITKFYATGERAQYKSLLFESSKVSFLLLLIIVVPLIFELPFILDIWLGEGTYPQYTISFTQLLLVNTLIEALSGQCASAIQATGNIKRFQIITTIFKVAPIIVGAFTLSFIGSPIYAFVLLIVFSIPCSYYKIKLCCQQTHIPISHYLRIIVARELFATAIAFCLSLLCCNLVSIMVTGKWGEALLSATLSFFITTLIGYAVVFSYSEKKKIVAWLKEKIKNYNNAHK